MLNEIFKPMRRWTIWVAALVLSFGATVAHSAAADLQVYGGGMLSFGTLPYADTYSVTISGPGGWQREVSEYNPSVAPMDDDNNLFVDGLYNYEVRGMQNSEDMIVEVFSYSGQVRLRGGYFEVMTTSSTVVGEDNE